MHAAKSSLPGFKFSALDEFLNQCQCMSEMLLNIIPNICICVYIYTNNTKTYLASGCSIMPHIE